MTGDKARYGTAIRMTSEGARFNAELMIVGAAEGADSFLALILPGDPCWTPGKYISIDMSDLWRFEVVE